MLQNFTNLAQVLQTQVPLKIVTLLLSRLKENLYHQYVLKLTNLNTNHIKTFFGCLSSEKGNIKRRKFFYFYFIENHENHETNFFIKQ
jgi:hypothetical protein